MILTPLLEGTREMVKPALLFGTGGDQGLESEGGWGSVTEQFAVEPGPGAELLQVPPTTCHFLSHVTFVAVGQTSLSLVTVQREELPSQLRLLPAVCSGCCKVHFYLGVCVCAA